MGRSRAKHKEREALYDYPEVIQRREALKDKVLAMSPRRPRAANCHQRPDEMISVWMSGERQEAEKAAEKYWKDKFIDWHARLQAELGEDGVEGVTSSSNRPHNDSDYDDLESSFHSESGMWLGLDPNDPDAAAIVMRTETLKQETSQLSRKQDQLEQDVARAKEQLQVEKHRRKALEEKVRRVVEERDAWCASSQRHEAMEKVIVKEQQDTNAHVAEIERHVASLQQQMKAR